MPSGPTARRTIAKLKPGNALHSSRTRRGVSQADAERAYLTASEVGTFVYCPEAWFLQRFGHVPDADARLRMQAGTRAHRQIGRSTEQVVVMDAIRRGLLGILVALAALLLAVGTGWLNLVVSPW